MSIVTKPVILDDTGKGIRDALDSASAAILAAITNGYNEDMTLQEVVDARDGFQSLGQNIKHKPYYFDNVESMKKANLKSGDCAITLGYYEPNDGGNAEYMITNTQSNSDYQEELNNGLYANLIIKDYVNPIMFGCYGDGAHDDTLNLQESINYCESKKLRLSSHGNKIYKIVSTLNVDTLIANMNNATITTNNEINIITINSSNYYGQLEKIKFDCTNANSGIYIQKGMKKTFKDLIFENISNYGFYFNSGYEVLLTDSHFNGNGTAQCVGIYANSSDSKFENIVMIDCYTSIINKGANFFEYVHSWIRTPELIDGSIMFDLQHEQAIITQCYTDTYQNCFNMNGGSAIINQLKAFYNSNIYPSDLSNPILFKKTSNTTDPNCFRTSIVNSDLRGMTGKVLKYVEELPSKIKCNNNNLSTVINYDGGIKYTPTTSSQAISIITNDCWIKNGVMYINLLFTLDTSISSVFNFSNLPQEFRPQAAINTNCVVADSQWTTKNANGYLYINDKISGTIPDNGQVQYVKIVQSYPIANENY